MSLEKKDDNRGLTREDEMGSWSRQQVYDFLIENKIEEEEADKLRKAGVRGELFFLDDLDDLGVLPGELKLIRRAKNRFLNNTEQIKNKKEEKQEPRKFGETVSKDTYYTLGSILPCESTNFTLDDPCREYKEFGQDNVYWSDADTEEAFISKLGKFAAGCINSRVNGTIHFGVADLNTGKYKHGEIIGVNIALSTVGKYEEWIGKHFKKDPISLKSCSPEQKLAFASCISKSYAIPIRDSNRLVLEIDITPGYNVCKNMTFKINIMPDVKGNFYVRKGTSSIKLSPGSKEEKRFLENEASVYIQQRKNLEEKRSATPKNAELKLKKYLNRGELRIPDDHYKYILLINRFCTENCCNMTDTSDFKWVEFINWRAIFDFDPSSKTDGILCRLKDQARVLVPPHEVSVDELKGLLHKGTATLIKELEYGRKTLHVSCLGNNETGNFTTWRSNYISDLERIFDIFTSEKLLEISKSLIFVICASSNEREKEMEAFLKRICIKKEAIEESIFIGQSEIHMQFLKDSVLQEYESTENLSDLISERSIIVGWPQLNEHIQSSQSEEIRKNVVQTSTRLPIQIKPQIIEMFKNDGMSILSSNECAEIKDLKPFAVTDECKKVMLTFLRGKDTPWALFYFHDNTNNLRLTEKNTSALVERDIVKAIKAKIDTNLSDKNTVATLRIRHLPGTGATTATKHVLWQLKSEYRCALIDGKILNTMEMKDVEKIASNMLDFRAFGEDKEAVNGTDSRKKCLPLLIMLDNCSEEDALLLQRKIQDEFQTRGLKCETTIGIIIYIERGAPDSRDKKGNTSSVNLHRGFSEQEREKFESKLNQYHKYKGGKMVDMLGFLTLMNSDDPVKFKPFIRSVVQKIIDILDKGYPTEMKLCLYLSIFKCYGEKGTLSLPHCSKVLDFKYHPDLLDSTSEYFQMIVREKEEFINGKYPVLEISLLPVAEVIIELCLENGKESLFSKMSEILENKALLTTAYLQVQSKLLKDLVDLAVFRRKDPGKQDKRKDKFSPLVKKLMDVNRSDTTEMLRKFVDVFEDLKIRDLDGKIAHILQTLSRVHLEFSQFEEAKEFANQAIEKQKNLTFYDTLGQVLKKEFFCKLDRKDPSIIEVAELLEIATNAIKNFRISQDLLRKVKSKKGKADVLENIEDSSDTLYTSGYHNEIRIIQSVAQVLLKSVPKEKNEDFRKFISGDRNVGINDWAITMSIDLEIHGAFLSTMLKRSQICFSEIFKDMDSKKIKYEDKNELHSLSKNQINIFLDRTFDFLPNYLNKTDPSIKSKIEKVKKCCDFFLLRFLYFVRVLHSSKYRQLISEIMEQTHKFSVKANTELDNIIKLCILNVNLLNLQNPVLSFEEACKYSFHLSSIVSEDHCEYETFFWYMVLHWPTDAERKRPNTYDEIRLLHCIRKLKIIDDDKCFFVQKKGESQRKNLDHDALYFVANEIKYGKLIENQNTAFQLEGKIKDESNVEYTLPHGTPVFIRARFLHLTRNSRATEVKFHLGFTLAGPVAYNIIPNTDGIQKFNKAA